jgi:hypothetical protein
VAEAIRFMSQFTTPLPVEGKAQFVNGNLLYQYILDLPLHYKEEGIKVNPANVIEFFKVANKKCNKYIKNAEQQGLKIDLLAENLMAVSII